MDENDRYSVGWIAPLPLELTAAIAALDERYTDFDHDQYKYYRGRIGRHNIVVAVQPRTGTNSAASLAARMKSVFRRIEFFVVVGIAGGVPTYGPAGSKQQIVLGDVVVSRPRKKHGGIVQSDAGAWIDVAIDKSKLQIRGHSNGPSDRLLAAINCLESEHDREPTKIPEFLKEMRQKLLPGIRPEFEAPDTSSDRIFDSNYLHDEQYYGFSCEYLCDLRLSKSRGSRGPSANRERDTPKVHYGNIASSNQLQISASLRDELQKSHDILAFEMESAGVIQSHNCLAIRGICDYSDSHKNKIWQRYAAATAAAYAKELLRTLPTSTDAEKDMVAGRHKESISGPERDQTEDNTVAEVYKLLLDSLSFSRQDARIKNIVINPIHKRACNWIFEQHQLQDWRDSTKVEQHKGFLWIKGKPGSGKSTIMKMIFSHIKEIEEKKRPKSSRNIILEYFFNARAFDTLEKSSLGMYRSLTHQILKAKPELEHYFVDQFSSKVNQGEVEQWTINELQSFLLHVAETLETRSIVLFIDALDEGEESDVREMIGFIEQLGTVSSRPGGSFNVCLSSRHFPHITVSRGLSLIVEDQPGHKDSIAIFVSDQLKGEEDSRKEELRVKLCRKSAGVFLWLVLVIPMLNSLYDHGEVDAMEKRLDEIPEQLDGLFAKILKRDNVSRKQSVVLLQWALFSNRPLSPAELYIAIKAGCTSNWSNNVPDEKTIKRYLLNCSRGLTEISKSEPPIVQFIHETVREFLLRRNGLVALQPNLEGCLRGSSHDKLRKSCSEYIARLGDPPEPSEGNLRKRQRSGKSKANNEKDPIETKYPFVEYATSNVLIHADTAEGERVSQKPFLKELDQGGNPLLRTWITWRNYFQPFKVRRYKKGASLLHIASEYNLSHVVRVLIAGTFDLNRKWGRHGTALNTACANGHDETASVLIQAGADVNAIAGEHQHALLAAIFAKADRIVSLLIEKGANPPREKLDSPLVATVTRGYALGVVTLLKAGADPNALDGRPLHRASYRGHQEIVKILLDHGAHINWQQENKKTHALYEAACKGHEETVKLLIDNGADVNTKCDGWYGNALCAAAAAKRSSRNMVQMLLAHGAQINDDGGKGSVLYHGSDAGNLDTVELLLDQGADVNAAGGSYGTALQVASRCGRLDFVKLLLDHDADVNAQGGRCGNALQAASNTSNTGTVKLLIDRGADVNLQGGYYGTALQAASTTSYTGTVKLLLDHGADVNAKGGFYGTALQAASDGYHLSLVKLLLENRADVNALCGEYKTAYQAALRGNPPKGWEAFRQKTLQLLIDYGADVNLGAGS